MVALASTATSGNLTDGITLSKYAKTDEIISNVYRDMGKTEGQTSKTKLTTGKSRDFTLQIMKIHFLHSAPQNTGR